MATRRFMFDSHCAMVQLDVVSHRVEVRQSCKAARSIASGPCCSCPVPFQSRPTFPASIRAVSRSDNLCQFSPVPIPVPL